MVIRVVVSNVIHDARAMQYWLLKANSAKAMRNAFEHSDRCALAGHDDASLLAGRKAIKKNVRGIQVTVTMFDYRWQ
jgi:hypothetical protein